LNHEISLSRWFCSYAKFTGLPASCSPQAILDLAKTSTRATQLATEEIMAYCHDLRQKLNQMHKMVMWTKTEQNRKGWFPQEPMQTSLWEILFWMPLALW